jgi:hypothetical protein
MIKLRKVEKKFKVEQCPLGSKRKYLLLYLLPLIVLTMPFWDMNLHLSNPVMACDTGLSSIKTDDCKTFLGFSWDDDKLMQKLRDDLNICVSAINDNDLKAYIQENRKNIVTALYKIDAGSNAVNFLANRRNSFFDIDKDFIEMVSQKVKILVNSLK